MREQSAQTRSMLLVEDNAADAGLIMRLIAKGTPECDVTLVGDGVEALEHLRSIAPEQRPDLILLDLNLPRKNGLETLAELKADEQLRLIPVIVLTTSKSAREINRSYELHASAVMNKPIRLAGYREMLQGLTDYWMGSVSYPVEVG